MLKDVAIGFVAIYALSFANAQTPQGASLSPDFAGAPAKRSAEYDRVQKRLQQGWNTWDVNTVSAEVLLPEGLEIRLGLKRNTTLNSDAFLPTILLGREGPGQERVKPGPHALNGGYSSFEVTWGGTTANVQSAHAGEDLVMLVMPQGGPTTGHLPATAVFSVGFLWNNPGTVRRAGQRITASSPGKEVSIYLAGKDSRDPYVPLQTPYFSADLSGPVGISTGRPRSIAEIQHALTLQREAYEKSHGADPQKAQLLDAIETSLAWDTIYEPHGKRVISTVTRLWDVGWGGYVLFDWDTFFGADLAATKSRELAYANVLEILNELTPAGFVPNFGRSGNWKSFDRSEPPVGAATVLALYRQYHDRWLLRDSFDRLLKWNRWWTEHRDMDGYLVWGSDGQNVPTNLDDASVGTLQGARYESGIDNGPQFDAAQYDSSTHQMEFADAGLMGMYIADANALAEIADLLEKKQDAEWLRESAAKYQKNLSRLWDPETGIFLNKDLHTGKFDYRLSPTNFYPLLAKAASPKQADEMIQKHLLNPDEFWGERVLPAIARNDPAFKDQNYWRGRIWAPMNFLVYEGLKNYSTPIAVHARRELAEKSHGLFMTEWIQKRHVHENYSGVGENSDTVTNSDRFYHWGALLELIECEELPEESATAKAK